MTTMHDETLLRQINRLFGGAAVAGLSDAQLLGRFLAQRDEDAFAALVARHGPMVLAVCRGILRDWADAEDAFQATFLILVRRAASVRGGASLGGWLHRVAHRVAVQAHKASVRRHAREQMAAESAAVATEPADETRELRSVVQTELARLPERLRLPLVLCDLDGLTRAQAAARLDWTEGIVRGRLAKARRVLRGRLARRGLAPAAGTLVAALARPSNADSLPDRLLTTTVRAAAGRAGEGPAAVLASSVIRSLVLGRVRSLVAATLVACLVGWGAMALFGPRAGDPPVSASAPAQRDTDHTQLHYRGRVVDPQGRPVAAARSFLVTFSRHEPASPPRASTDHGGRFAFSLPLAGCDDPIYFRHARVAATAEGFGVGLTDSELPDAGRDLTLRLVEDLPIEGRVVDMEGRPVSGASVRVTSVWSPPEGDLTPWLRALAANEDEFLALKYRYLRIRLPVGDQAPGLFPPVKTDSAGRFVLRGVGRERLAEVQVEAPSIRSIKAEVITRVGGPVRTVKNPGQTEAGFVVVHGTRPVLVAAPDRPIVGMVRDAETGAPIAGATIRSLRFADARFAHNPSLETTCDAQGHYRLEGMPRGAGNEVTIMPAAGQPYLPALLRVDDPPGLGPVTHDVDLARGIVVEGRVTDRETGAPVPAVVSYVAAAENPNLDAAPGFRAIGAYYGYPLKTQTTPDGTYRLAALPGRGAIVVEAIPREYPLLEDGRRFEPNTYVPELSALHVLVEIDLRRGEPVPPLEVRLDRGRSVAGTVLDSDGTPLVGTYVCGLEQQGSWTYQPLGTPTFQVVAIPPVTDGEPAVPERTLLFVHPEKQLAGWCDVGGVGPRTIAVRLAPSATVNGRIVDGAGKPLGDVIVSVWLTVKSSSHDGRIGHRPNLIRTGADGRFQVEGLPPGLECRLAVRPSGTRIPVGTLSAGETREVGTIVLEAPEP